MFPHGEPVTRLRAAEILDPYSKGPVDLDWENPRELVAPTCAVWQEQSNEPDEVGREQVITVTKVAFPAGFDIAAADRFVARGETYQVHGDPFDWTSPFSGWRPGVVATGRKVDG